MYCKSFLNRDGSITFLWEEGDAITVLTSEVLTSRSRQLFGGWCSTTKPNSEELTLNSPYTAYNIFDETFAFFRENSEEAHSFIAWPSYMANTSTLLCNEGVTDSWQKNHTHVLINGERIPYTVLLSPKNALTYIRIRLLE